MQQKQILKMQQVLIHKNLLRKVDNKDIEKLKDVDKLVPVPVDLTKLMMLLKKFYIMLK